MPTSAMLNVCCSIAVFTFATVGSTSFVLIGQEACAEAAWVARASPLQFSRCHSTSL
jgi:hypothetical protein